MSLQIELEKTHFKGGDMLRGEIVMELTKPQSFEGVRLKVIGKEMTSLSKVVGSLSNATSISNIDSALSKLNSLARVGDSWIFYEHQAIHSLDDEPYHPDEYNSQSRELDPGTYRMPFSVILPSDLLPSVSYKSYGTIMYYVSAKMHSNCNFLNNATKALGRFRGRCYVSVPFSVRGSVFPNELRQRQEPVSFVETKQFPFSFKRGKLQLETVFPRKHAIPGENFPMTLNIDNRSNKEVEHIDIRWMAAFQVLVRDNNDKVSDEKWFFEEVFSLSTYPPHKIKKGESLTGHEVRCKVPEDLIPSFSGKLFSLEYTVIVKLLTKGGGKLEQQIPDLMISLDPAISIGGHLPTLRKFEPNPSEPDIFNQSQNGRENFEIPEKPLPPLPGNRPTRIPSPENPPHHPYHHGGAGINLHKGTPDHASPYSTPPHVGYNPAYARQSNSSNLGQRFEQLHTPSQTSPVTSSSSLDDPPPPYPGDMPGDPWQPPPYTSFPTPPQMVQELRPVLQHDGTVANQWCWVPVGMSGSFH